MYFLQTPAENQDHRIVISNRWDNHKSFSNTMSKYIILLRGLEGTFQIGVKQTANNSNSLFFIHRRTSPKWDVLQIRQFKTFIRAFSRHTETQLVDEPRAPIGRCIHLAYWLKPVLFCLLKYDEHLSPTLQSIRILHRKFEYLKIEQNRSNQCIKAHLSATQHTMQSLNSDSRS